MRLPKGILSKISKASGIDVNQICAISARRRGISVNRSIELESACKGIGLNVPKELWLFGSSHEIKAALTNNKPNIGQTP